MGKQFTGYAKYIHTYLSILSCYIQGFMYVYVYTFGSIQLKSFWSILDDCFLTFIVDIQAELGQGYNFGSLPTRFYLWRTIFIFSVLTWYTLFTAEHKNIWISKKANKTDTQNYDMSGLPLRIQLYWTRL